MTARFRSERQAALSSCAMAHESTRGWENRSVLAERVAVLIGQMTKGEAEPSHRDGLLLSIARFQARRVEPYRRLLKARGVDAQAVSRLEDLPAVPTDVFRAARVAVHPPSRDVRIFRTSGTTGGPRGSHHLSEAGLRLYDLSARESAAQAFFAPPGQARLISLIAHERESPDSSLAYMVARFFEWFAIPGSAYVWKDGRIRIQELRKALDEAAADGHPVCLLGTSFAYVHVEENCRTRWRLPSGSRILQTGGFKGRTREFSAEEMRGMLEARYGVPQEDILAEYGMTELSSQIYERTLPRRLVPASWLRVTIVHPETLRPVQGDDVGLVRIEDPANVDTAWAVQTSDLGRRLGEDGFELLGRASGAALRGCSLAVEEALG